MNFIQMGKRLWVLMSGFIIMCVALGCAATVSEKGISQDEIPKKGVLRVGVTPTAPPLIFYQDGRVVGLEAEFASGFAESLGKTVQFAMLGWNDLIPALLENRIDIIMSGMSITKMRETRISFTSPDLKAGQMALVRKENFSYYPSVTAIKKTQVRVGFEKGTTGDFLVQREFLFTSRKSSLPSLEKGVQLLAEERIDMFIHDAPVIWWVAAEEEAKGLVPIPILLTEEYLAWGVRKDDTKLLELANQFLASWKSEGKLKKVVKLWMPYAPDKSMP